MIEHIENDATLEPEAFGTLAICSVRYALGRMTYMPEEVSKILRGRMASLMDKDLFVLQRDIREHLTRTEGDRNTVVWVDLEQKIKDEMARRGI